MSTRAVYTFTKTSIKPDVHIYIHHDGYPEGAKQCLHHMAHQGIGPEALLRTALKSGITSNWKHHSDLEYRYEIRGRSWESDVMAYQCKPGGDYTCFGCWTLLDFINSIDELFEGKPVNKFQLIDFEYTKAAYNTTTARAYLTGMHGPLSHLRAWKGKHEGSYNWRSCIKDLQSFMDAFPGLMTSEIEELLKPRPLAALTNKE